jgi:hypothetical protein
MALTALEIDAIFQIKDLAALASLLLLDGRDPGPRRDADEYHQDDEQQDHRSAPRWCAAGCQASPTAHRLQYNNQSRSGPA